MMRIPESSPDTPQITSVSSVCSVKHHLEKELRQRPTTVAPGSGLEARSHKPWWDKDDRGNRGNSAVLGGAPGKCADAPDPAQQAHRERAARLDSERLFTLATNEKLTPEIQAIYKEEFYRRADACYEEAEGLRPRWNASVWAAFPPNRDRSRFGRGRYMVSTTTEGGAKVDTTRFAATNGSFLKVQDLEAGPIRVSIGDVTMETAFGKDALVLDFSDHPGKLRLNPTRTREVQALFGRESEDWIGQAIELYMGEYVWNGETKDCVSIRAPTPAGETSAPSPATQTEPAVASTAAITHNEISEDDLPF